RIGSIADQDQSQIRGRMLCDHAPPSVDQSIQPLPPDVDPAVADGHPRLGRPAELLARRMAVGVRPTIHVPWVRDIYHTPTIRSIRAPDPFGLCCASDHKDTTGSDGPWAYQCFKGRESMLAALERRGIPIAQKSRQHRNHIEARIFVFLTKHHVRPQASQGLNSAEKRSSRIRYKCTQGS